MSAETKNIIELMGPREVIGQAIALLMANHQVSRDAAFEMLVRGSSVSGQRVRKIAEQIIEQAPS